MSATSSSGAGWSTPLRPPVPFDQPRRPDDPKLGESIEPWAGDENAIRPGRAVLVGFPQDEGVRRNAGRVGAAEAPGRIRHWLYRLTPWDGASDTDLSLDPPLDLGDLAVTEDLEASQQALAGVVAAVLARGAVPVVLGGGHETAYGHFLGYVQARKAVGIINLDAHLDVRPTLDGKGHSGSPFRQALEHPTHPLPGPNYVCLGLQASATSRNHWEYARGLGCELAWAADCRDRLPGLVCQHAERIANSGAGVMLTLDADAVKLSAVPGVSAPNVTGLSAARVLAAVEAAGVCPSVTSFELVEVNPRLDVDDHSSRWAALAVWNFLCGLARRRVAER